MTHGFFERGRIHSNLGAEASPWGGISPSAIVVGGRIFASDYRITRAALGSGLRAPDAEAIHVLLLRNG